MYYRGMEVKVENNMWNLTSLYIGELTPAQNDTWNDGDTIQYTVNMTLPSGPAPGQQDAPSHDILAEMKIYFVPMTVAAGFIGNGISSLTFLSSSLRRYASSHYLAAACVSDTLFLTGLLLVWFTDVGLDVYNTPGGCQFLSFLNSVSAFLSLWYMAAFAVDLLINHVWPLHTKSLSTPMRAKIVILSLMTVAIVVFTNLSLTVGVFTFRGVRRCAPHPMFLVSLQWLSLLDGIFNILLPYLTIFVIAVLTIFNCGRRQTVDQNSPSVTHIIGTNPREGTIAQDSVRAHGAVLMSFLLIRVTNELFRLRHILRMITLDRYPVSQTEYQWQQITQNIFYVNFAWKLLLFVMCLPSFRKALPQHCRRGLKSIRAFGHPKVPPQDASENTDIEPTVV